MLLCEYIIGCRKSFFNKPGGGKTKNGKTFSKSKRWEDFTFHHPINSSLLILPINTLFSFSSRSSWANSRLISKISQTHFEYHWCWIYACTFTHKRTNQPFSPYNNFSCFQIRASWSLKWKLQYLFIYCISIFISVELKKNYNHIIQSFHQLFCFWLCYICVWWCREREREREENWPDQECYTTC